MPPIINPRSIGSSWGIRLAIMAGRVLPPGGVEQTLLVYPRCDDVPHCGDPECLSRAKCYAGGMRKLVCRCGGGLIIHGPLTAPLGVSCETCGARDNEAQAGTGTPPGYTEAMARIAEWNATIDQRIERREHA
jgi:hypothetical protein